MKETRHHLPKPTEVELELLRALWGKGAATVRELYEVVSRQRALGYTSVLKTLQIMTDKGLVERSEAGKAHIYRASASQEETQNQLLRDLSARLFAGSAAQLAMHALSMEPASAEELEEIRRIIRQKKERQ
jgi:BlaI family transcriptional regulator, penicillinase repressor